MAVDLKAVEQVQTDLTAEPRAIVLQQPNGEKIQVELKILQVADDTAAIHSFEQSTHSAVAAFDYATGVAVFLALCATGLAYWFGVRSFRLTELSFKAVSEDIKSAAETYRITTMQVIENQSKISNLEFLFKEKNELRNRIIERSGEFLTLQSKFIIEIYKYIEDNKSISADQNEKVCKSLNELNREILSQYHMLLLTIDDVDKAYDKVHFVGNIFLQAGWDSIKKIKENTEISNLIPSKEMVEKIMKKVNEKNLFTEDELKKLNYFKGNTYEILTSLNIFLQNELRDLIKRIKAA